MRTSKDSIFPLFSLHMQGKEHFLSSSLYFMRKRDKSNPNINCGAAAGDPFFLKAAVRQLHFLTQNRLSIYVKAITMQYIAKKTYRPKHHYEGTDQPIFKKKSETSRNPFFAINTKGRLQSAARNRNKHANGEIKTFSIISTLTSGHFLMEKNVTRRELAFLLLAIVLQ